MTAKKKLAPASPKVDVSYLYFQTFVGSFAQSMYRQTDAIHASSNQTSNLIKYGSIFYPRPQ